MKAYPLFLASLAVGTGACQAWPVVPQAMQDMDHPAGSVGDDNLVIAALAKSSPLMVGPYLALTTIVNRDSACLRPADYGHGSFESQFSVDSSHCASHTTRGRFDVDEAVTVGKNATSVDYKMSFNDICGPDSSDCVTG